MGPPRLLPSEKRLFARRSISSAGCWDWTGATSTHGYGMLASGRRAGYVHRLAWQFWRGEIPKDRWVLHRCDNKRCFNPDHLFLGTHADNMMDAVVKKRHAGTRARRLSEDDVRFVRQSALSSRKLAAMLSVSQMVIVKIRNWKCYREVA